LRGFQVGIPVWRAFTFCYPAGGVYPDSGILNFLRSRSISACDVASLLIGGGIYNSNGRMTITNCTVVGNSAVSYVGGIVGTGYSTYGTYGSTLNTIVVQNTQSNGGEINGKISGSNNLTTFIAWDNINLTVSSGNE